MLKGKQRSYLKKLSHNLKPMLQIGKNGVSEEFLKQLDNSLELHELIKISVLDNSDRDMKEIANTIVNELGCEFVSSVGFKLVVYRESSTLERKDRIIIWK